MAHAFILIPDRLIGEPMTVFEAVKFWSVDRFPIKDQITWTTAEQAENVVQAHRVLWLALATSELHAFVQSPEVGSWFRIPRGYWFEDSPDLLHLMQSARVPETLVQRVEPCAPELLGQPIVFWRAEVMAAETDMAKRWGEYILAWADQRNQPDGAAHEPEFQVTSDVEKSEPYAEERRIAAILEAQGTSKRHVLSKTVQEHWNGSGRRPNVTNVLSFMSGANRGGRPKIDDRKN